MMLSGLIEVTVKVKPLDSASAESAIDEVKVTTDGPKYDAYVLEQENLGLK